MVHGRQSSLSELWPEGVRHSRLDRIASISCLTPPMRCSPARSECLAMPRVFEREFWTNTPGELALVWDSKGQVGNALTTSGKKS